MTQNGAEPDTLAPATDTGHEDDLAVALSRLPDVHSVEFSTRHGAYDRTEVDRFLGELLRAITEVRAAASSTRQELAALRAENAQLRGGSGSDVEEEITAGAMGLLTQAQLIADKAIADAEQYARDLVLTARNQYREILERAEASATQATGAIPVQQAGPAIPEIEYVRTYARVAQVQLRSVLDSLTEQVDRLGSLPQLPQQREPVAGAGAGGAQERTGEPDWAPSHSEPPARQG